MDADSHGNMWDNNNDPIQTWGAQWAWRDKQGRVASRSSPPGEDSQGKNHAIGLVQGELLFCVTLV